MVIIWYDIKEAYIVDVILIGMILFYVNIYDAQIIVINVCDHFSTSCFQKCFNLCHIFKNYFINLWYGHMTRDDNHTNIVSYPHSLHYAQTLFYIFWDFDLGPMENEQN